VLAPATVQELIDLTVEAFDIAERYLHVVVILTDGSLGQMMEPAELPEMQPLRRPEERPNWALTGAKNRPKRSVSSIHMQPSEGEEFNLKLQVKHRLIEENEVRFHEMALDDARIGIVAFGTAGRVVQSAVREARAEGIPAGLLRPISLFPFPTERVRKLAEEVDSILVVEMNSGQMLDDVRLAVEGRVPVEFFARMGGVVPLPDEVLEVIKKMHTSDPSPTYEGRAVDE
jgi:2-oxoglutarate/2-oxoacid ferredoxin oxidoreductase subunit alpha